MNGNLELLARIRGDLNELFADHKDVHGCMIFHGLCGRIKQLAEALGLDWREVEAAWLRQEEENPTIYQAARGISLADCIR